MEKQKSPNSTYPQELKDIASVALALAWAKHVELDLEAEQELSRQIRATRLGKASNTDHGDDHEKNKRKLEQSDCSVGSSQNPHEKTQERVQFYESARNQLIPDHPVAQRRPEIIGQCSKEVRKRLTDSDVNNKYQRLQFCRSEAHAVFNPVLTTEEKQGLKQNQEVQVTVYAEDGKEYKMCYKYWSNEKSVVLTKGWKDLYNNQELKASDDVCLRMFRHNETNKLCLLFSSCRNPQLRA